MTTRRPGTVPPRATAWIVAACLALLSCSGGGSGNGSGTDIGGDGPAGADAIPTEDIASELASALSLSHGKKAPDDYDRVFGEGVVHRIDLVIPQATYAAMLAELEERLGPPGGKGGKGDDPKGPPPKAGVDACVGLAPGTECSWMDKGVEVKGKCTMIPFAGGILFCMPAEPPPGIQPLTGWDPSYVEISVKFEEELWEHVGMRFKGNSTLNHAWQIGKRKFSFRLNFDKYEDQYPETDDQRFWGFQEVIFNSNWRDDSMIREFLACELFRKGGVKASRAAFYRVFADVGEGPVYWGLYTLVEDVSDSVLDNQFDDDDGNLYKPDGAGADFTHFDAQGFVKKTNEELEDWSDVQAVIDALHADPTDADAWRAGLDKGFAVEAFLRWLALNTLVGNWDSYGNIAHNYYLYADWSNLGRLTWIPWDLNEAFRSTGGVKDALSLGLAEVTDKWPLIRYLADEPAYFQIYRDFVADFADTVFAAEATKARMEELHTLVAPYVVGPEGEQGEFTLLESSDAFTNALVSGSTALLPYVDQRHEAAKAFLGR
ncbi:MAG: cellulosomal protein [Deltaproteobacteria bacterium]|nr:cellulosomal protein [Deltaproteobacteria bacterium]